MFLKGKKWVCYKKNHYSCTLRWIDWTKRKTATTYASAHCRDSFSFILILKWSSLFICIFSPLRNNNSLCWQIQVYPISPGAVVTVNSGFWIQNKLQGRDRCLRTSTGVNIENFDIFKGRNKRIQCFAVSRRRFLLSYCKHNSPANSFQALPMSKAHSEILIKDFSRWFYQIWIEERRCLARWLNMAAHMTDWELAYWNINKKFWT